MPGGCERWVEDSEGGGRRQAAGERREEGGGTRDERERGGKRELQFITQRPAERQSYKVRRLQGGSCACCSAKCKVACVHQSEGAISPVTSCGVLRSGQSVLKRAGGLHTSALSHVEEDVVQFG